MCMRNASFVSKDASRYHREAGERLTAMITEEEKLGFLTRWKDQKIMAHMLQGHLL